VDKDAELLFGLLADFLQLSDTITNKGNFGKANGNWFLVDFRHQEYASVPKEPMHLCDIEEFQNKFKSGYEANAIRRD
jgi:hypothetical protein